MACTTVETVLAAFVDVPRSVSPFPVLVVHPFAEEDAEGFEGRLAGLRELPPALGRVNRLIERSPALRVYSQVDARRRLGVWEAFDVERAMREAPLVKAAGLPFDEGTALGRLPDPRAWNVLALRPVSNDFLVKSAAARLETFRDAALGGRVAWRFKLDGSNDWLRTPSFGREDLKAWARARRWSFADLVLAEARNTVIHADADGGVERDLAVH